MHRIEMLDTKEMEVQIVETIVSSANLQVQMASKFVGMLFMVYPWIRIYDFLKLF
jgi:predicted transcriptional regulator